MIQGIIFIVYLIINIGIGLFFFKKNDTLDDYFLGGRQLNPWAAALSAQASDMSGWLLLGLPGLAYALYSGTTEAIWTAIGLAAGTYINWLFVAKRLRKYTYVANNSITLPVYFENRFHDKTKIIRTASGLFILLFFLIYTAAQFSASAKLFSTVFGFDYSVGLAIGAVVIVGYTFLGGFKAVCWTDVVQGTLMFFALLLTPFILVSNMGGIQETQNTYQALTNEVFSWLPKTDGGKLNSLLLISALGWGLGYFGQPHILVRFMAVKTPKEIKPARVIATVWVLVTLFCGVIIGLLGAAFMSGQNPADYYVALVKSDPEKIFIAIAQTLFNPWIAGILLTSILAAIMSTADSQLLVTASTVTEDLYLAFAKKRPSDKALVWMSRVVVIIISLIAIIISLDPKSSVFGLVKYAWGGFGAAFGPVVILSLYWKRATSWGAMAGIIGGGVIDIIWESLSGGIFDVYGLVPAFFLSMLLIVVVSLCTTPDKAIEEEFEKMKKCEE